MCVLVVGSVALDTVETPFGSRAETLGGSATYFSMSASYFAPVKVVAVVGEDFPEPHVKLLEERGIDLSGLSRRPGRTFRWKGRYSQLLADAQTLDTQLNVFEHFEPQLPAGCRSAPFVFLGNIDPVLQRQVLDQIEKPKLVAADTMNFWINGKPEELKKTLERVDLLFVNDSEARLLAGEHNVVKAAKKITAMGPRMVVVKRGEHGAFLFDRESFFASPAFPVAEVSDPTGAGDTFAGGFMGYLANAREVTPQSLRQALVMGGVMASFTIEGFSLDRLRSVSEPEIFNRFKDFKSLTSFGDLGPGPLRAAS